MNEENKNFMSGVVTGMAFTIVVFVAIIIYSIIPTTSLESYINLCNQVNEISPKAVYKVMDEGWYWDIQNDLEGPFETRQELVEDLLEYTIQTTWNISLPFIDVSSYIINEQILTYDTLSSWVICDPNVPIISAEINISDDPMISAEINISDDPLILETYHFVWDESSQLVIKTLRDGQLELIVIP